MNRQSNTLEKAHDKYEEITDLKLVVFNRFLRNDEENCCTKESYFTFWAKCSIQITNELIKGQEEEKKIDQNHIRCFSAEKGNCALPL